MCSLQPSMERLVPTMKKFVAMFLAVAFVCCISLGCGDEKDKSKPAAAKDKPADTKKDKDK